MTVHRSVSTWQQSVPPPATPKRSRPIEEVARQVVILNRPPPGGDGRTASGRTSVGHELAEQLGARQ